MKQKDIIERMQAPVNQLKRGLLSIYECEHAMAEAIMDGILEMPADTAEQAEKRIATMKKLKRRMWRMLLEATK